MATFGKIPPPGGTNGTEGGGLIDVCKATMAAENGTATGMSFYVSGATATCLFRGVIYNDSAGTPGTLLAVTSDEASILASDAAGWVSLTISAALTSGTLYHIGFWTHSGDGFHAYWDAGAAADEHYKVGQAYSSPPGGTPADPFPASPSTAAVLLSVYVTYTPATPAMSASIVQQSDKLRKVQRAIY